MVHDLILSIANYTPKKRKAIFLPLNPLLLGHVPFPAQLIFTLACDVMTPYTYLDLLKQNALCVGANDVSID